MATKIRLQRGGRKGYAVYRVVVADERAPRDGRFIEKLGTYNPNTVPAGIDLNFERALHWVECGAQPTDTARMLLKHEGVYLMKHLRGGVRKGAFDEATAQARFDEWKAGKDKETNGLIENEKLNKKNAAEARLKDEKAKNEAKAKAVAEKQAAAVAAEAPAEEAEVEAPATEEAPAEAAAE